VLLVVRCIHNVKAKRFVARAAKSLNGTVEVQNQQKCQVSLVRARRRFNR
jgi:hypothetical protein